MNCANLRILLDKANDMAANNFWGKKAFVINMKIWLADNNNFAACTRLARYYKLNGNSSGEKSMYLKALEIYPNNREVRNNLNDIERLLEETQFIDELTTSRECYNSGRKLTQRGYHWLASECYRKAYSIEPSLEYGIRLARSYNKLGEHDKIKKLYKELMDSNSSSDIIADIKFGFIELLSSRG